MSSSFDAVQATLRHMHELFTPGYPMCFTRRMEELFFMVRMDRPYRFFSEKAKTDLYSAACCMDAALKRFKLLTNELITMARDAKNSLRNTKFHMSPLQVEAALDNFRDIRHYRKLNLVVPFATLKIDGFSNLTET